jgi:surface-anchored protein
MKLTHPLPLLLLTSATVPAASLVTGGHLDFPAFGYVSNADVIAEPTLTQGFEPHIHNEGGADGAIIDGVRVTDDTEFEPDELIVVGKKSSTITVNSTTYFWLPETEQQAASQGVPFVGIGLEELAASDWVGGTVTISLLSFSGPGDLLLWQDNGFGGANIFLDTANNDFSMTLAAGSHTHFNWGFTEEGVFDLEFGISASHVSDGLQSASATYTMAIPEPASALLAMVGLLTTFCRRR